VACRRPSHVTVKNLSHLTCLRALAGNNSTERPNRPANTGHRPIKQVPTSRKRCSHKGPWPSFYVRSSGRTNLIAVKRRKRWSTSGRPRTSRTSRRASFASVQTRRRNTPITDVSGKGAVRRPTRPARVRIVLSPCSNAGRSAPQGRFCAAVKPARGGLRRDVDRDTDICHDETAPAAQPRRTRQLLLLRSGGRGTVLHL
jgi:hypothetical protein